MDGIIRDIEKERGKQITEFDAKDWVSVLKIHDIPEEITDHYMEPSIYTTMANYKEFDEGFIRRFHKRLNWYWLSGHEHLSEEIIREFSDLVDWNKVSLNQKLSDDFIEEFKDQIVWILLSGNKYTTEHTMKRFKKYINWLYVSTHRKLTYRFIEENLDVLVLENVLRNENVELTTEQRDKLTAIENLQEHFGKSDQPGVHRIQFFPKK